MLKTFYYAYKEYNGSKHFLGRIQSKNELDFLRELNRFNKISQGKLCYWSIGEEEYKMRELLGRF